MPSCFWVPPHPLFGLLGYSHPPSRCCADVCPAVRVSMRIPGSPLVPPVAEGQLAPSQVPQCGEDPWVSQSSPRLAAVKGPFVVLPCTPRPAAPNPRGHRVPGGMSSSLQESGPSAPPTDTYKGLVFIIQPMLWCICLHPTPYYSLPQFLSCPTRRVCVLGQLRWDLCVWSVPFTHTLHFWVFLSQNSESFWCCSLSELFLSTVQPLLKS